MAKLRSETEEAQSIFAEPTPHKTAENQREVRCGMCSEGFYVDEVTFNNVSRAIQEGLDNPFLCDACEAECDELAYER